LPSSLSPSSFLLAFLLALPRLLTFSENPRTLVSAGVRDCEGDLKELSPTVLVAVPTIFERIMHTVNSLIKKESSMTQTVFHFALQQQIQGIRAGMLMLMLMMMMMKMMKMKMKMKNKRGPSTSFD